MSGAGPASTLKDSIFPPARYREVARLTRAVHPAFDTKAFLRHALKDLDALSLMQRLRRMTESVHVALPGNFHRNLGILRELAPRLPAGFGTLFLRDYVALYGRGDPAVSLEALRYFTRFGSAAAPDLAAPPLEALRADPSLYVRKSVANHLNDVTRAHPTWVLDRLEQWPRDNARTAWIVKRALRTLIKAGDRRALAMIGAGEKARVRVLRFGISPVRLRLGGSIRFALEFASTSTKTQQLVVDYAVHYVTRSGASTARVFKWKEITVGPRERIALARRQQIRDFTTRKHYPGRHVVEVLVNGEKIAGAFFDLA